jgi:hypothetical protein
MLLGLSCTQAVGCIIAVTWYFVARYSKLPVLPAAHIVLSGKHGRSTVKATAEGDAQKDHEAGGPFTTDPPRIFSNGSQVSPSPRQWTDNDSAALNGTGGEEVAADPIVAVRLPCRRGLFRVILMLLFFSTVLSCGFPVVC